MEASGEQEISEFLGNEHKVRPEGCTSGDDHILSDFKISPGFLSFIEDLSHRRIDIPEDILYYPPGFRIPKIMTRSAFETMCELKKEIPEKPPYEGPFG